MRVTVVMRWFAGIAAVAGATIGALLLPTVATEGLAPDPSPVVAPPVVAETTLQVPVRPAPSKPAKPARAAPERLRPVTTAPAPLAREQKPAAQQVKPQRPSQSREAPVLRIFASSRIVPPSYAKPARGKVVDRDEDDDEDEDDGGDDD